MSMPWWLWIIVIALGLFFALALFVLVYAGSLWLFEKMMRYAHRYRAKQHNKKARKYRLEKDEWFGYPLPTGKSGRLVITEETQIVNAMSYQQLENAYQMRAKDLGVELWLEKSPLNRDIVVKWGKPGRVGDRNK